MVLDRDREGCRGCRVSGNRDAGVGERRDFGHVSARGYLDVS